MPAPHPEPWRLSATEMLAAYRSGQLTPRAVVDACLARRDAVQPLLNAFVAQRDEAARADADASTARWHSGSPCGPLDGVPVVLKDNLPTADMPTTWGSPALRSYRPAVDELAVARVRAAGAIVLGKTNVPEFTLEGYTSNPLFGTTGNPWNPALTPGGSSGGAAAAVAAGCAPLALGTDGGGSIRRPASHTGLVGLKPSIGSIARDHALPPLLLDLEVVGTLARTVQDTQLLFDAVCGPDAADRRSYAAAAAGAATPRDVGVLRVLYVPTLDGAPVDPQIAASCRAAAAVLGQGGCVEEGPLPLDIGFMATQWASIGQIGLAALFAQHPTWRDGASAKYLDMAAQGAALPAAALWALIETMEQLRRDAVQLFRRYDVLVTPSAAALPWPAAQAFPPTINGQAVGPRGHAVFTGWVNAAGLPAVALPSQPSAEGLPIGIQAIGPYGADARLLQIGAAYEKLSPWAHRWPTLSPHTAIAMNQEVQHAVAALVAARRSHQPVSSLQTPIRSPEAAYAVQDGVGYVMGWFDGVDVPVHWKSGGPARDAELTHAPLPPQGVWASPADARNWPFAYRGIEGEIALRLGQAVTPAQAAALDVDGARALVDAMCVSIEIVDFRWADAGDAPAWNKLADALCHGALVLGDWVPYQTRDWQQQRCVATIGAQPATTHTGTHSLGDPAFLLPAWLRHATRTGHTVPAGTVVTTGSWIGLPLAAPGDLVRVEFDGMGAASVQL